MWNKIEELINLSQQPIEGEPELKINFERRHYYRFFYHLLIWRKPKIAIEIGVEGGVCSWYMARAAQQYGGWVIGIDINNLLRRPDKNYLFIHGSSIRVETWNEVSRFCNEHGSIGIVFQDSSHHYEESKKEWEFYSKLLDKNAIWVCDDITSSFHDPNIDPPGLGMVQYFDELPGNKRLYKDVLHCGNTQGIVLLQ